MCQELFPEEVQPEEVDHPPFSAAQSYAIVSAAQSYAIVSAAQSYAIVSAAQSYAIELTMPPGSILFQRR
jgi:hypothetical protein